MWLDLSIFYFMDSKQYFIFAMAFPTSVDKIKLSANSLMFSLYIFTVSFSCLRLPSSRINFGAKYEVETN